MKINRRFCFVTSAALATLLLGSQSAFPQKAEPTIFTSPPPARESRATVTAPQAPNAENRPRLRTFDLEFGGGTPADLVAAIRKQSSRDESGQPVNVVIPPRPANTQLPPLAMRGVTVPQVFEAITRSSAETFPYKKGDTVVGPGVTRPNIQMVHTEYGFKCADKDPTENSVWYFFKTEPLIQPDADKACRNFHLGRYLDRYTIEDISTAIRMGWKMMNPDSQPTMSFHKETQLLIAAGSPSQLALIDDTLAQLEKGLLKPKTPANPAGQPKEKEKEKAP